jgi:D-alanyl-D-alanine carboxypeptidase (penicillin-binding protein 5/6)
MKYSNIRQTLVSITLALALMPQMLFAQISAPSAPNLNANAYLLMDFASGRVLASKNAEAAVDPASITKLMTAYAVFRAMRSGQISMDDKVLVSEKAWRTPGSRMFIEVGKRVSVGDLLPGMIVQSGNDASVALAEHVAGTEETFAEIMNQLADELGMYTTRYRNSTGLPAEGHLTSASDISVLAAALIRQFPDYYKWYSQKQYTYNGITQGNRNALLWRDESVDGMKTGYTESAGYCLVSSAERNGMRLIAVVLGTKSPAARANESQALLNYGFRFFETHKIWEAGEIITDARVWKGASDRTSLIVNEEVYVTIPRGTLDQIEADIQLPPTIFAPLDTGSPIGEVHARLGVDTVATASLYSATAIEEGGLLGSVWDELLLWFE